MHVTFVLLCEGLLKIVHLPFTCAEAAVLSLSFSNPGNLTNNVVKTLFYTDTVLALIDQETFAITCTKYSRSRSKHRDHQILCYISFVSFFGGTGQRSGERARFPLMWPEFKSCILYHKWAEFIVDSRPCSEGFSPGSPVFLPPQKSAFLNSNSIRNSRAMGLSVIRLFCVTLVTQS